MNARNSLDGGTAIGGCHQQAGSMSTRPSITGTAGPKIGCDHLREIHGDGAIPGTPRRAPDRGRSNRRATSRVRQPASRARIGPSAQFATPVREHGHSAPRTGQPRHLAQCPGHHLASADGRGAAQAFFAPQVLTTGSRPEGNRCSPLTRPRPSSRAGRRSTCAGTRARGPGGPPPARPNRGRTRSWRRGTRLARSLG